MTVKQKIVEFLQSHRGEKFCEACLRAALGLMRRAQVSEVIRYLSSIARATRLGFARELSRCSVCGATRLVVWAL